MNLVLSNRAVSLGAWICLTLLVSAYYGSLSWGLLFSVLVNLTPLLLLSFAAAVAISCGEIDISIGALLGLCGTAVIFFSAVTGANYFSVIIVHFAVLATILLYYRFFAASANFGLSTLIVSIGVLLVAKGFSTLLHSCMQGVGEICRAYGAMGNTKGVLDASFVFKPMSYPGVAVLVVVIATTSLIALRDRTTWGLEHLAVGMDRQAASFARVSVKAVRVRAFLLCGLLVFIAMFARLHGQNSGGWSANTGWGEEILAIAIAVIGGTRITGGRLEPVSISMAAFAVFLTRDIVTNDLGVPSEVSSMIFGLALLMIVTLDMYLQPGKARAS